jgi:exopolysaccharide biosynthesis WecB/TagA/CpsF family protein
MPRTKIIEVDVDATSMQYVLEKLEEWLTTEGTWLTTFVNPSCITFAVGDEAYRDELAQFDLVLPDGIALARTLTWRGFRASRISFDSTSLAPYLFEAARRLDKTIMLVGGKPDVAAKAAQCIVSEYPGLRMVAAFDGYDDVESAINFAVQQKVGIVVCAMGRSCQENFLLRLRKIGWKGCGFTCGGYFDQLADGFQYYPKWIDDLDIRWAYRMYKEPGRLWRRYVFEYGMFCWLLIREAAPMKRSPVSRQYVDSGSGK